MKNKSIKERHLKKRKCLLFRASSEDFRKIPGSPIAYWVSENFLDVFYAKTKVGDIADLRQGMATGDNDRFLRYWNEVDYSGIGFFVNSKESFWESDFEYAPYNKGGTFRKWYGNNDYVIRFNKGNYSILKTMGNRCPSEKYYFREGATWSALSSTKLSLRLFPIGFIFSDKGQALFADEKKIRNIVLFLNSIVSHETLKCISPTLDFHSGYIRQLPIKEPLNNLFESMVSIAVIDWDSFETSWDFTTLPILQSNYRLPTISDTYSNLRSHWLKNTLEMQRLEEENNRIFIEAYGLQDELTPEVPLSEITLTCNPHYRYKGNKTEAELEALLLTDTMKEFISYAVGCILGRYSLDRPGLILANQGETIENYLAQIPPPTFCADGDNVIPILDGDWFSDDVTERFFKFLHVTFGDEHYEENLQFIENAIGKSIRKYFLKDFYNDHVRRYKKRPIYWMFSSSKGSFNVLIYMHRYRPDTVSVILNGYLREFRAKLNAKLAHLEKVGIGSDSSKSEKAKAIKELEKLRKVITEVEDYERDVLYPLATEQVEIDLDEGVKVNYNKFGTALKKITGLTERGSSNG